MQIEKPLVVLLCDVGSKLEQLEAALHSVWFQQRVPDHVVVGLRGADPDRLKLVGRFGYVIEQVDRPWPTWLSVMARRFAGSRIAVIESDHYWPVQRLSLLGAQSGSVVAGPCGDVLPGMGGDRSVREPGMFSDQAEEIDRNCLSIAGSALLDSEEFLDPGKFEGWRWRQRLQMRKWRDHLRSRAVLVSDRLAARYAPCPPDRVKAEVESFRRSPTLQDFRDRHRGQRAFVIGNGPSLAGMNLEALNGEVTFASNAIFLLFRTSSFRPRYYACIDSVVLPDRAIDIQTMLAGHPEVTGFFPRTLSDHDVVSLHWWVPSILGYQQNACFYESREATLGGSLEDALSVRPWEFIRDGRTVTVVLLQLAYLMGCNPIYLVGCDTDYRVPASVVALGDFVERPDRRLISTEDDPNHFAPDYFGKGRIWHQPNTRMMIDHYQAVRDWLEPQGVQVFNATVGGKLEVFPRVSYEDLFTVS